MLEPFAEALQQGDRTALEALLYAFKKADGDFRPQISTVLANAFPKPPTPETRTPKAVWRSHERTSEAAADSEQPTSNQSVSALEPLRETASFSVLLWLSIDQLPKPDTSGVVYSAPSLGPAGLLLAIDSDGRLILDVGDENNNRIASKAALKPDHWRFVAVTYDHQTGMAALYVDGDMDATKTFPPSLDNFRIKKPSLPAAEQASIVHLDDVSIYETALNAGEIASIHFAALQAAPFRSRPSSQRSAAKEVVVDNVRALKEIFSVGVPPGTVVKIAPGDYVGPFSNNSTGTALRASASQPIVITALDRDRPPVLHLRNSWLGSLKHVHFRNLDFTGRMNIDGSSEPDGVRAHRVSFMDVRWYLCGWGGGAECLKATKADAVIVEHVTFFAIQAYLSGLEELDATARARMSPLALESVDQAIAAGKHLGRATESTIDFVAVNDSLIRSVSVERSGTHTALQIKGGSARNVVENNYFSGWAVRLIRMSNRTINLAGGTCDDCFRNEGYREFEAYDTIVRGNRIECGDTCGAIATQYGTEWTNNTHWMLAGRGACDRPAKEPGTRWAMRLLTEGAQDHRDEVRPSQNALFARNVWIYNRCHTNAQFVNHSPLCADDVDLSLPGKDCVAAKTIHWRENVVFEADWENYKGTAIRHCEPHVSAIAADWERVKEIGVETAGLGDISFQCLSPQGSFGIDPKMVDGGLPSMRITEPHYTAKRIGANAVFTWGSAPTPGARR